MKQQRLIKVMCTLTLITNGSVFSKSHTADKNHTHHHAHPLQPCFDNGGDFDNDFIENFSIENFSLEVTTKNLPTDIYKKDNHIIIDMQAPGIEREDISIELLPYNRLKIAATRETKEEVEKENFYKKEIRSGSFEQIMQLPYEVESEGIQATMKNGVLSIKLPLKKDTSSPSKKIEIQQN